MVATAMYTNICTNHGLNVLDQIMKMLAHNLSKDFPLNLVMHTMTLIVRFNVFEAGDNFHHQTSGTAMVTPITCPTPGMSIFVRDVNNFGLLKWKVENKGREVNFLDLTIKYN